MESLREYRGDNLTWTQPSAGRRTFELRDGAALFGTLTWQRAFGSLAIARTADGAWTLKRAGFLRPRINVWTMKPAAECAVYEAAWTGSGRLQFPDGHCYEWRLRSFWKNIWAFESEDDRIAAQFQFKLTPPRQHAQLTISPESARPAEVPLLAVVGFYVLILVHNECAATTAAVISAY
jgi:hypothetical protein